MHLETDFDLGAPLKWKQSYLFQESLHNCLHLRLQGEVESARGTNKKEI